MLKIKTNYNSSEFAKNYEKNSLPSMTVPNQAMSVRELIIRFASGLPVQAGKVPIYEGDEEFPDIDKMDLIEREDYYQDLRKQRQEAAQRVKDRRTEREKIKMDELIKSRIEAKQKEQEQKLFEEFKKSRGGNNEA